MSHKERPEEEWARQIVEKKLGRKVTRYDNGSASGMYDLRVEPLEAPEIAIECVGAVDPVSTETWNMGQTKGPRTLSIEGDWRVVIDPGTNIKHLKKHLEPLLQALERQKLTTVAVDFSLKRDDPGLYQEFKSLGITYAFCYRLPGAGNVSLGMPGRGGARDHHGSAIPGWVSSFLRDPGRQDVLDKLTRSGAAERHAFIFVELYGAPWPVESYFWGKLDHLPNQAPDLPAPVTAVWVVGTFGQEGLYWDGSIWQSFSARVGRESEND